MVHRYASYTTEVYFNKGCDLMKIKHKLKPKVVNEIVELRDSREDIMNFMANFLENIGLRYDFIHTLLNEYKTKKEKKVQLIKTAAGLYLSSLVTCWETFFRDTMVFVIETDGQVRKKAVNFLNEKGIDEKDILKEGISLGDFMCKQFNFQDLNDTCEAFNFLFDDNKSCITEYISTTISSNLIFSSPNFILYWIQQKDDVAMMIKDVLIKAFDVRHKVIHDANFMFEIDVEFMTEVEDCFILFPQFISIWLAEKYNQKRTAIDLASKSIRLTDTLSDSESLFIFSRQDLEAEYVIAE